MKHKILKILFLVLSVSLVACQRMNSSISNSMNEALEFIPNSSESLAPSIEKKTKVG